MALFGITNSTIRHIFRHSCRTFKNFHHHQESRRLLSAHHNLPQLLQTYTTPKGTDTVSITWNDGHTDEFPAVFLRDNCICPKCFLPSAGARLVLMKDVNEEQKNPKASFDQDANEVVLEWPDGHESRFSEDELRKRSLNGSLTKSKVLTSSTDAGTELWDSSYQLRRHDFNHIIGQDQACVNWLTDLAKFGLTIVQGMPPTEEALPMLVKRIAFPENTHYNDFFTVKQKLDANNAAYTGASLGLHNDLPFYNHIPSVQFLHCIEQFKGQGGGNEFVDAFMIEKVMREQHPAAHKYLSSAKIAYRDRGSDEFSGEFYKMKFWSVFNYDAEGKLTHVAYNNQVRQEWMSFSPDETKEMYTNMKLFNSLLYSQQYLVCHKLLEGECVVFDNLRVMHGRTGYEVDSRASSRFYNGVYVSWDEVLSRLNVLNSKLS